VRGPILTVYLTHVETGVPKVKHCQLPLNARNRAPGCWLKIVIICNTFRLNSWNLCLWSSCIHIILASLNGSVGKDLVYHACGHEFESRLKRKFSNFPHHL